MHEYIQPLDHGDHHRHFQEKVKVVILLGQKLESANIQVDPYMHIIVCTYIYTSICSLAHIYVYTHMYVLTGAQQMDTVLVEGMEVPAVFFTDAALNLNSGE